MESEWLIFCRVQLKGASQQSVPELLQTQKLRQFPQVIWFFCCYDLDNLTYIILRKARTNATKMNLSISGSERDLS